MANYDFLHNDWHVVATAQDIRPEKPFKARLLGEDIVLWRKDDQILAWQDRCPHRGASLARGWVEKDTLVCPYHGFAFDDQGQCVKIPSHPELAISARSKACVKTFHAQEHYGMVWVCLGTPQHELPLLAEWENPNYDKYFFGAATHQSSALRTFENFLDINHLPFVHQGTLSDPGNATIAGAYEIDVKDDGIHIHDVVAWQVSNEMTGKGNADAGNYHIARPLTVFFRRGFAEERMVILFTVTPIDEEVSAAWRWMLLNHEVPEKEFREMTYAIIEQDVEAIESQTPRRLPLDLQAEFHLPSDRTTITYRKWLRRLGVTFGAI